MIYTYQTFQNYPIDLYERYKVLEFWETLTKMACAHQHKDGAGGEVKQQCIVKPNAWTTTQELCRRCFFLTSLIRVSVFGWPTFTTQVRLSEVKQWWYSELARNLHRLQKSFKIFRISQHIFQTKHLQLDVFKSSRANYYGIIVNSFVY